MSETNKQTWLDSLTVYKDIRMLRILLLGAISGFPCTLMQPQARLQRVMKLGMCLVTDIAAN